MENTNCERDPTAVSESPIVPAPRASGTGTPRDPPISSPSLPASKRDDDITTKIFRFLSTATPGTLGGVAVGFAATTYLVFGQLGLVLIGAFGGIAIFVQWEARNPEVARAVRGERGVDVLARLLETGKDAPTRDEPDADEQERVLAQSFADFRPETKDALSSLVDAIIRDYVKWWKVLTSFLVSMSNHLSRKRPADTFLDLLTNSSSLVIVFFSELSAAFAEMPVDSNMTAADAIYNYLASNPDSSLANLLSQKQQAGKFRMIAEDLLGFLDRSTYDCDPARTFLREILAGVILETTLQTCSKPEWINGWIVYLLEAGEPDFSQAIDVGMQTGPDINPAFADIDGNIGNISLTKGNRNSFEMEKARRKESTAHKKKLSKADEEMEEAIEEMKRMNQMIAEEEARRARESKSVNDSSGSLAPGSKSDGGSSKANGRPDPVENTATAQSPPRAGSLSSTKELSSDGRSSREETVLTPVTPRTTESSSQRSSPSHDSRPQSQFTSFDQLVPPVQDEPETSDTAPRKPPPLTLHNATITILDDGMTDNGRLRTKPASDYLIQVEPASSHYPGWMTIRKFTDFENLHEILRRIATISGATAFAEQHGTLPNWKVHTRASLRGELERYVRDACWYQSLAESEGMKKFLEKDQGHNRSESKSGFLNLETMGKNMLDVLAIAPKGVAESGKAITGGITGVFGNMGLVPRKPTNSTTPEPTASANRLSVSSPPRVDSGLFMNGSRKGRDSMDSQRSSVVSIQPGKVPPMDRRPSYNSLGDLEGESLRPSRSDRWDRPSPSALASRDHSRASSMAPMRSPLRSPSTTSLDFTRLPPPPDTISDDHESPVSPFGTSRLQESIMSQQASLTSPTSLSVASTDQFKKAVNGHAVNNKPVRQFAKLSEQETRVAVELTFAIINEMYTLSSAWNIRRTLLAAAKSFLLRPGNPSLASIQAMIQESVIEENTSDAGIAAHLRKLRENTLPTEEERKGWPPEMTAEEKEKLRVKARRLLIQSGVPAALMGVMGQSATSEALGRVFDCLQIEEVARGLIFGIMLQAVRVVTH
ncbi:PX domain-containing protein [Pleurostoma richardsiae]|uniref:PX domain-containing protein n=1 Tax=Pleurostoma richardsiae TaxID=41990 RepID=A0AA38RTK5_9PEZI|nr:PX domain-containing protein [Pleurostoma richardsiae]